jgi:hypothetical protein
MNIALICTSVGFFTFLISFYQTKIKNNPFGLTPLLLPLGIFVWGDGIVFGLFWFLVGLYVYFFKQFDLLPLIFTVFWIIRSSGEVIYWFLQQFASVKRDQPETLPFSSIFPGESVWFALQIMWQCVLVVSIVVLFKLLGLV